MPHEFAGFSNSPQHVEHGNGGREFPRPPLSTRRFSCESVDTSVYSQNGAKRLPKLFKKRKSFLECKSTSVARYKESVSRSSWPLDWLKSANRFTAKMADCDQLRPGDNLLNVVIF